MITWIMMIPCVFCIWKALEASMDTDEAVSWPQFAWGMAAAVFAMIGLSL